MEIDLIAYIDLDEDNEWTNGQPGDMDWRALEHDFKRVVERWLLGRGARVVDVEWVEPAYKAPNPSPQPRNYSPPASEHGPTYGQHMRDAGRGEMVR